MIKVSLEYMLDTAFNLVLKSKNRELINFRECFSHLLKPLLFYLFEFSIDLKLSIVIYCRRYLRNGFFMDLLEFII
jgi:hypothetical protein